MKICSIDGCKRKYRSKGYCEIHYARYIKHGNCFDKSLGKRGEESIAERIERFSIPIPESGCIIWIGSINPRGYGTINIKDKTLRIHRYIYEMTNGPIPKGLFVCHKCDVPSCINPHHLYAGTAKQNAHDRDSRGRANTPKGTDYQHSKFTEEIVLQIRNSSESNQSLAEKYGASRAAIRKVRIGESWKHVL